MSTSFRSRPTVFTRSTFLTALGLVGLGVLSGRVLAGTPAAGQDPPEAVMKSILEATKEKSYDAFLTHADSGVRAGISKQMFDGVAGMFSARLQKGYKTTYLAKLRQKGYTVHLWKLEFADGKDEVLFRLTMDKDGAGKYSGVLLQ